MDSAFAVLLIIKRAPIDQLREINRVDVKPLAQLHELIHFMKIVLLHHHADAEPFKWTFAAELTNEFKVIQQPREVATSPIYGISGTARCVDRDFHSVDEFAHFL